jgi:glyoxylate/hydroxypyruvate reductase A
MIVLLVTARGEEAETWRRVLHAHLPDIELRVYPQIGDPAEIDVAMAWKAPHGVLTGLPRLKLICSLGMGVDHLLEDPSLPANVPIARLVDPQLVEQMSEYALYGVLHFHRRFDVYERFQRARCWQELPLPHTSLRRVGVMGLGEIGADCARKIAALGFPVSGWSRSAKVLPDVKCHCGSDGLAEFLAQTDILLAVLPLTPATMGIINARTLSLMPRGSYLVNIARGGLVDEQDLLAALESGQLEGALLDVTATEPPRNDHHFWLHPRVRLTPHIAGLTNPDTAAEPIAANIRRLMAGEPLLHLVDRQRGY